MQLIDGKKISEKIYSELQEIIAASKVKPKLAVILASNDPASQMYIKMKTKKANDLGIATDISILKEDSTLDELISKIRGFNENTEVNGILVQLPMFPHLEAERHRIVNSINPIKDPDGLSAINLGLIEQSVLNGIIPATVDAILEAIKYATSLNLPLEGGQPQLHGLAGKNILIINNTDLIGKPLSTILATLNATVTIANKFSINLKELTAKADIIISATGQTELINAAMIKEGAILIDVTSIKKDDKTVGDFIIDNELEQKASWITPVPGGIGPLTIACLLRNLVNLTKLQQK